MDTVRLKFLNRRLADYLGMAPSGTALYKWIHSRDLNFGYSKFGNRCYEFIPQVEGDRWVLAMWQAPPSAEVWEAQTHGEAAYPRGGYYLAVDTPADRVLTRGEEPTERMTMYIIDLRRKSLNLGYRGILNSFKDARQFRAKEQDRVVDDILTNSWTAFGNIPGKKESVSFPSTATN